MTMTPHENQCQWSHKEIKEMLKDVHIWENNASRMKVYIYNELYQFVFVLISYSWIIYILLNTN